MESNRTKTWVKVVGALVILSIIGSVVSPIMTRNSIDDLNEKVEALSTVVEEQQAAEAVVAEVVPTEAPAEEVVVEETVKDIAEEIRDKLFEDDAWESESEVIASEEFEDRDYKDIADAINDLFVGTDDEVDDRDDIIYVRDAEDTDFYDMDATEKDADLTQYLKVKYENKVGDEVKVYLTVDTVIEEGEVEDQDFEITP